MNLGKVILNIRDIGKEKIFLLIVAGIVLVICSIRGESKNEKITENNTTSQYEYTDAWEYKERLEQQLTDIIRMIDGAGEVKVMITLKASSEKVVKEDSEYSRKSSANTGNDGVKDSDDEMSNKVNSVMADGKNGSEPYIIKSINPIVSGTAIVAQGGDNPIVESEIIKTAKALLGIEANKISVSKMR